MWLSNGTTLLDPPDGNVTGVPGIVDLVGISQPLTDPPQPAASYEGAPVGSALDVNTSANRNPVADDTNNNSIDFDIGPVTPRVAAPASPAAASPPAASA